jgi:hypothetical protein
MGLPVPLGDVQGEASRRLRGEGKVDLLATVALVVAPIQSSREKNSKKNTDDDGLLLFQDVRWHPAFALIEKGTKFPNGLFPSRIMVSNLFFSCSQFRDSNSSFSNLALVEQ